MEFRDISPETHQKVPIQNLILTDNARTLYNRRNWELNSFSVANYRETTKERW